MLFLKLIEHGLVKTPSLTDIRHEDGRDFFQPDIPQSSLVVVDARIPAARSLLLNDKKQTQGTPHSWSANASKAIQALFEEGELDQAVEVLLRMDQPRSAPPVKMYRSLLNACARRKALSQTKRISSHLAKSGWESTSFLGESVVSTLVKCGGLEAALEVFHRLPHKTVSCWTAVISGYTALRQGQEALKMYQLMQDQGVQPNAYTFVSLLKACSSIPDLDEGKRIHGDVVKHNCHNDVYVGNCLVDMYGKCGSIVHAQNVFEGLVRRDVVSWNAMLAVCAQQGEGDKGVELYKQMQAEGISANARTFVSLLQLFGILAEKEEAVYVGGIPMKLKSLALGRAVHADAEKKGFDADVFVGSTLVSMYGKCGSIGDARAAFDGLSQRNVVSWNAMLAVYAQQGEADKALQLYDDMQVKGVSPTYRTLVSALQACGMLAEDKKYVADGLAMDLAALDKGRAIHATARKKGYDRQVYVGSALVSMYGKFGSLADARKVFDAMSVRDVVSWNAMMAACVEQGQSEETLQLYRLMQQEGVSPDACTIVSALQACRMCAENEMDVAEDGRCTKVRSLETGRSIHADARKRGYDSNLVVGSILITLYGKCGSIVDALEVFKGLSEHDVVSWNAMLAACVEQGYGDSALQLYQQMVVQGTCPNEVTLVSVAQACSQTGSLDILGEVYEAVEGNWSPLLANTVINAYGKCARMVDAQVVFDSLPQPPDVVSWNALIAGYARQGDRTTSLLLFQKMQGAGVSPNGVTFLSLLSACGHGGLADEGVEYFESMSRDHGIRPGIEHYACLVDLLGRTGCFEMIEELLASMPVKPDLSIWLCLLGACRKHGKVELGRRAFDCAVRLQPRSASAYVLMSSIYAQAGMWELAREVHGLRQAQGAWKKPGQSWIEQDRGVQKFVVGECEQSHQDLLEDLLSKMS